MDWLDLLAVQENSIQNSIFYIARSLHSPFLCHNSIKKCYPQSQSAWLCVVVELLSCVWFFVTTRLLCPWDSLARILVWVSISFFDSVLNSISPTVQFWMPSLQPERQHVGCRMEGLRVAYSTSKFMVRTELWRCFLTSDFPSGLLNLREGIWWLLTQRICSHCCPVPQMLRMVYCCSSLTSEVWSVSHSIVSASLQPHGLQPARLLCPWNSPGKNTGAGRHSLLQGIFPIQGSNPGLLYLKGGFFTVWAIREAESP